jgi:osmoprotectant transport system ATP-binding protein
MIRLDGVSVRLGRGSNATQVLDRLDLAIPQGATVALVGPSGCGKSTILRTILGLIRPDAGSVVVGEVAVDATTCAEIRRRTGFVIQDGGLFPHLTGASNAALPMLRDGWDAGRIDARLSELADLVELDAGMLDRYPLELSGGQRQRIALMRALALKPEILLLDEPLGALDPRIRWRLQRLLRSLFDRLGTTVVLVTHDLAEADWFTDDIVLLHEGRIRRRGTLTDIASDHDDDFVAAFVESHAHLPRFDEGANA